MNPTPPPTGTPQEKGNLPEPRIGYSDHLAWSVSKNWPKPTGLSYIESAPQDLSGDFPVAVIPLTVVPRKAKLRAVQRLMGMSEDQLRERLRVVWRKEFITPDDVLVALGLLIHSKLARPATGGREEP